MGGGLTVARLVVGCGFSCNRIAEDGPPIVVSQAREDFLVVILPFFAHEITIALASALEGLNGSRSARAVAYTIY